LFFFFDQCIFGLQNHLIKAFLMLVLLVEPGLETVVKINNIDDMDAQGVCDFRKNQQRR